MTAGPLRSQADGVTLAVRLTPKAAADRILGLAPEADGGKVLKAAVTAVPENGKANAALIKLLAKAIRMPKSALRIAAGATDRRKTIHIAGDPAILAPHLSTWLERIDG